jgi:hypothetical protein
MAANKKPSRLGFRGYDKVTEEYSTPGKQPTKITREYQPGKTFWDWLQLLIIPFVLASATLGFGLWQAKLAQQQHDNDQQIAQDNRQNDLYLSNDQQQEVTLETYLKDMSDLLLTHNLRNSKPGDEVRQIARMRTLTTLRRLALVLPPYVCPTPSPETTNPYNVCPMIEPVLKTNPNRIVLQFLQDTHLVGGKNAVIDLRNANLSNDDLRDVNLSNVDLSGADLSSAQLNLANLSGANLGAILIDGKLTPANLDTADLSGADLTNATITQHQLNQVYSCIKAMLPKGLTCHQIPFA